MQKHARRTLHFLGSCFFTRGTEDPMPERWRPDLQVDAVSSASRDDRVQRRAQELAALLEERF
jgi:hypothetical protein